MAEKVMGKVAVVCNECKKEMSIPTADFYQKREGGTKLTHSHYGGFCKGTFSTVNQRRPKTHKASRDRKPRANGNG